MSNERPDYIEDKAEVVTELSADERTAYEGKTLAEIATEVRSIWKEKKETESATKELNGRLEVLSKYLAERMETEKVDGFRVAGVGTVYISHDNKPYVNDRETFFKYLRENGDGAMIKEAVHPMSLLGWVNERLKNNLELPSGVHNFILTRAKIRK